MRSLAPLALTAGLAAAWAAAPARAAGPGFEALEPGLELASFEGPTADGEITVARLDPYRFELKLLAATMPGEGTLRSARAWAYRAGASAAINAAMYQEDHRTSVSLMRTREHVNQRRVSKDKAFLAFDPVVSGVAPARILDLECDPLGPAGEAYGALVQSIRLVSCHRRNVWAPSDRRTSAAAIGVDGAGRLLFVHARTPWPVHELVNRLLALPIDLRQAMYVEGGPEAQLFVRGGQREVELTGTWESAPDVRLEGWPVPNVIVAVRRPAPLPRPPTPAVSAPRAR
ncbi:MAG: phosphodiester glycosidase family protein [Anaeromyxobacteraceae bacterium]